MRVLMPQGHAGRCVQEKMSQKKPALLLSRNAAAGITDVRTAAGRRKRKPKCVVDYNSYMAGVGLSDRKIYHVSGERTQRLSQDTVSAN